jgi:hypothetical protein
MMNFKKRTGVIAAAMVVVLFSAVAAYAYWTAGGSGTGTAATGTSTTPITAVQTSTVTDMRPGTAAQSLAGNFTNPASNGPVYVTSVTASIASVSKATGAPAGTCAAADYTLAGAVMTVNAQVPTGTAQGTWTGATIMFNTSTTVNQDACKGATVNLAYTIV